MAFLTRLGSLLRTSLALAAHSFLAGDGPGVRLPPAVHADPQRAPPGTLQRSRVRRAHARLRASVAAGAGHADDPRRARTGAHLRRLYHRGRRQGAGQLFEERLALHHRLAWLRRPRWRRAAASYPRGAVRTDRSPSVVDDTNNKPVKSIHLDPARIATLVRRTAGRAPHRPPRERAAAARAGLCRPSKTATSRATSASTSRRSRARRSPTCAPATPCRAVRR